jgi:cbb3-type cytochrome oxidase maturation protein
MFWYVFSSIAFGLGGLAVYLYYHRQGQFDDLEDIKYQMFREDNENRK